MTIHKWVVTIYKAVIIIYKKEVTIQEETMTTYKMEVTIQEEAMTTFEKEVTIQEEAMTTYKRTVTIQKALKPDIKNMTVHISSSCISKLTEGVMWSEINGQEVHMLDLGNTEDQLGFFFSSPHQSPRCGV